MKLVNHIWQVEIKDGAPRRLDKALTVGLPAEAGMSRSRMTGMIRAGCVSQNDMTVTEPDTKTQPGDVWTIQVKLADQDSFQPEEIPLDVIYEDDELIVINKPAGLVVHPGRGNWGGTLVNALIHHCGEDICRIGHNGRPGIVHRLDKDTSGVMVAAKTDRAVLRLADQFGIRSVSRRYHACVRGTPALQNIAASSAHVAAEPGGWLRIEGAIGRHAVHRTRMAVVEEGGRHAVTRIRLLRRLANHEAALVECCLETGRTHQIRVHLETVGFPLIGDQTYGAGSRLLPASAGDAARNAAAAFPRQALHAISLGFNHPKDGRNMYFESRYPTDMDELLAALSGNHEDTDIESALRGP